VPEAAERVTGADDEVTVLFPESSMVATGAKEEPLANEAGGAVVKTTLVAAPKVRAMALDVTPVRPVDEAVRV
jgi:hypothetical protein